MAVIKATGDGACLFNAIAIGLAIEVLSGRLDDKQDSPAYQQLLEEFRRHHPNFEPQTWEMLKHWLYHYNDSRDIELLLAPVLFNLNKRYEPTPQEVILNEIAALLLKYEVPIKKGNKEAVRNKNEWWELTNRDALSNSFPRLDNLPLPTRNQLLVDLRKLLNDHAATKLSHTQWKAFLQEHAQGLMEQLTAEVRDSDDYTRGFSCGDVQKMANALSINLVENSSRGKTDKSVDRTPIYLINREAHWDLRVDDEDADRINHENQQLILTSAQSYKGSSIVDAPPPVNSEQRVVIRNELIDNPGRGDCAFYAFAIGLANIIQEEKAYANDNMFKQWVALQPSIAGKYEAICRINLKSPSHQDLEQLNELQRSLRWVVYDVRLKELQEACAHPGFNNMNITAHCYFTKFAELYHASEVDSRFNEFASSEKIREAINQLKQQNIGASDAEQDNRLVELFLKMLYGDGVKPDLITGDTPIDTMSPLLPAMTSIIEDFFWGAHIDLNCLAEAFKVNLHSLVNGAATYNFQDTEGNHVITIDNKNNAHWVTHVAVAIPRKAMPTNEKAVEVPKPRVPTSVPTLARVPTPFALEADVSPKVITKPVNVTDTLQKNAEKIQSNEDKPKALSEQEDLNHKKLKALQRSVEWANSAYQGHSKRIKISLFKHHGKEGRARAEDFYKKFMLLDNYDNAKETLMEFLTNKKNGNHYPHSFRTYLLFSMLDDPKRLDDPKQNRKPSLGVLSKEYNHYIDRLSDRFSSEPNYSHAPSPRSM